LKYLLDTNICIYLINGNAELISKIRAIGLSSIRICNATLSELYFGAYRSQHVDLNTVNILNFKRNLTIYSDSVDSAQQFGRIKSVLKSKGSIIEDFDIVIASIAIANNCVLVTNNVKHFKRIEELSVENWLRQDL